MSSGLQRQFSDIVRFLRCDAAMHKEGFDCLFRSLLTMINGGVERTFFRRTYYAGVLQVVGCFGQPGAQQFRADFSHKARGHCEARRESDFPALRERG